MVVFECNFMLLTGGFHHYGTSGDYGISTSVAQRRLESNLTEHKCDSFPGRFRVQRDLLTLPSHLG